MLLNELSLLKLHAEIMQLSISEQHLPALLNCHNAIAALNYEPQLIQNIKISH